MKRKTKAKNIAVMLCLLVGIMSGNSLVLHAAGSAAQAPGPNAAKTITIGVDLESIQKLDVSSQDVQAAWDVLTEGVTKDYGYFVRTVLYSDFMKLNADFKIHNLDVVVTTALNYLRMPPEVASNRDPDLYGAVFRGQKTSHYLLLVRADSGISAVGELQGKKLLLRRGDNTGRFYLDALLGRHGQAEAPRFFGAIQGSETYSQAVLAAFFKKGEACLVIQEAFETMAELNPQVGKQLAILDQSPAIANPVLFLQQQLPQDVKDTALKVLLNLETSVYGRQLLMLHRIDRLTRFEPSDLDSLRALLQEYEQRKH